MKLTDNYKIQTAEKITELAIQNGLISAHNTEEHTADAICVFFKTIVKNLDNVNDDSQSH